MEGLKTKILLVDDETSVHAVLGGALQEAGFEVECAQSAADGLACLQTDDVYSVVISDLQMPYMDGIEFLAAFALGAPDTVRIMITGHGDLERAIDAINKGRVFRFLTKPIRRSDLLEAVQAAYRQYELQTAERDLLERTLQGSVRMLTDLLGALGPEKIDYSNHLRANVRRLAEVLEAPSPWQYELAAMLKDLGLIVLPPELRFKIVAGEALTRAEADVFAQVPEMGYRLIARIPRLEPVADIVAHQNARFDAGSKRSPVPIGARMIRALVDVANRRVAGESFPDVVNSLRAGAGIYDPIVVEAIAKHGIDFEFGEGEKSRTLFLRAGELESGDQLCCEVRTLDGKLILKAGNILSSSSLERLRNYSVLFGIAEPIQVTRAV